MTNAEARPFDHSKRSTHGRLGTAWSLLGEWDRWVYAVLSAPTTPRFDGAISRLTNAADRSKISLTMAGVLAVAGGNRGRRAALTGVAAVVVTSTITNLTIKPLARRSRPQRSEDHRDHPESARNHVPMPESHSYPSGHSAAAFAFAVGVRHVWPAASIVPFAVAATVGYSRIHTGVHYPSDVLLGAITGSALGKAVSIGVTDLGAGRLESPP